MELVDVVDSKSTAGDSVPVRVRSPAPKTAVPLRGAAVFYWLITDGNRRFDPRCPKNTSRRRRIFGWQSARRSAQRKAVRSPAPTSNPLSCKGFEVFSFPAANVRPSRQLHSPCVVEQCLLSDLKMYSIRFLLRSFCCLSLILLAKLIERSQCIVLSGFHFDRRNIVTIADLTFVGGSNKSNCSQISSL